MLEVIFKSMTGPNGTCLEENGWVDPFMIGNAHNNRGLQN